MKILWKNIDSKVPNSPGDIKLVPEHEDDLWHAYNLIAVGDYVKCSTVRKILREGTSKGRDTERVRLTLEISVETIEYEKEGFALRLRGKNRTTTEHVKVGQFHTLEIDAQRPFVLRKNMWDSFALDILQQACDVGRSADLAIMLMQEGLANLFLIGRSVTITKSHIETPIPRKHGPAIAGYESAIKKFFECALQAVLTHVDFQVVKCFVIASPGFTKDQFRDYMLLETERRELRTIMENKSRILLAHASSGYKHSLKEVLETPNIMADIKDTKAAEEVRALQEFFRILSNDSERVCYGPRHVEVAQERAAIKTLLITDTLFRDAEIASRRKYVNLVDSVKDLGGAVLIFSSMHVSGQQLADLTGIAAILRFPLPELEEIEV